ncbi:MULTISPECIES: helix-turn-helix domain-containing protein [unclassified Mesorhizobium]|uniref:helix-turn-helix transcriptional regulator n=1 Tax=unclassified Mesorhizobium TaxID=325217 RepID=UPI0033382FB2
MTSATINLDAASQMGGASLLTPPEAAETLRVSARTLERWRMTGSGPKFVRIGPRRLAYRVADILAFAGCEQAPA